MVEGIKMALKYQHTEAFKKQGLVYGIRDRMFCAETENDSDEYFDCLARHFSTTVFHPVGTCKMGPAKDR